MQQDRLAKAVMILKKGGLVAFPTETVYGLGGDATNPLALNKIFLAKKRPKNHPLILHIGDLAILNQWVNEMPKEALALMKAFWPGPLTIILKKADWVPNELTGGQDTIGVRMPKHPVALALLKQFGNGLAAPSANQFGHISPTSAQAVYEELGDAVDLILEGGDCEVGLESTIVDCSSKDVKILRPGMITSSDIAKIVSVQSHFEKDKTPRVSGSHDSHYSPRTATTLIELEHLNLYNFLEKSVLLTWSKRQVTSPIKTIAMPDNAKTYAQILYKTLREVDNLRYARIFIEAVPDEESWEAIRDRLRRACH